MRGRQIFTTQRARELRASQTSAEALLWRRLRNRALLGFKFVRQAPIGPYFIDFLCREEALVIEIDGATHSTEAELAYDARRETFLRGAGFRILRVSNDDVFHNMTGALDAILATIEKRHSL